MNLYILYAYVWTTGPASSDDHRPDSAVTKKISPGRARRHPVVHIRPTLARVVLGS